MSPVLDRSDAEKWIFKAHCHNVEDHDAYEYDRLRTLLDNEKTNANLRQFGSEQL
jgi:hypothetical protein